MATLNVNLLKLLLVALLTIGGIKLTSLLPQGYYFSFAAAYSDELGAFIIPRPVLAARQQCELERAKGVSFRNCAAISETAQPDFERKRGAAVQAALEAQAQHVRNGEFEVILPSENETVDAARDLAEVKRHLTSDSGLEGALHAYVWSNAAGSVLWPVRTDADARFDNLAPREAETADTRAGPADDAAADELARRIINARQIFLNALRSNSPFRMEPISAAQAEAAASNATDQHEVFSNVFEPLEQRLEAALQPIYQQSLREAGIDAGAKFRELDLAAAEQNTQYVIALLLRLFIPFVVALAWTLVTADTDRLSLAVGAAFAAFILAWPVAMLWSSIVSESYVNLRPMFLAFYTAYVVSYLTAGYLGGSVGLALRGVNLRGLGGGWTGVGAFVRSLPGQVVVNLAANAATVGISYAYFGRDVIS